MDNGTLGPSKQSAPINHFISAIAPYTLAAKWYFMNDRLRFFKGERFIGPLRIEFLARSRNSEDDLRRICLAAQIADDDLRIWREEFLTTVNRGQP